MAESLSARRPSAHDMRARRPRAADTRSVREEQGRLQLAIAAKVCPKCRSVGQFKVTSTQGRIRHLKCVVCGLPNKIVP